VDGVDEIGAREGDGEWVRRAVELGEASVRSFEQGVRVDT